MAAELVETSRLWGRTVARIEPEWAEPLAPHLVKRTYSEPHWSAKRAAVMARERVTLYGVPLVADRLVGYGRVDPELSRELFIRHALVEGDWRTHHRFFAANRALLEDVEELEQRARRRDIARRRRGAVRLLRRADAGRRRLRPALRRLVEEGAARAAGPADVHPDLLVRDEAEAVSDEDYPTAWPAGGRRAAA